MKATKHLTGRVFQTLANGQSLSDFQKTYIKQEMRHLCVIPGLDYDKRRAEFAAEANQAIQDALKMMIEGLNFGMLSSPNISRLFESNGIRNFVTFLSPEIQEFETNKNVQQGSK